MLPSLALLIVQVPKKTTPRTEAAGIAKACAEAFQKKDKGWFEVHLAASFFYQDTEGERKDRAAMLDRLETWFHPFAYRVEPSLSLVTARREKADLVVVGDLKVLSQPKRFWRTPVTVTTMRVESRWRLQGKEWTVTQIVERSSHKTIDGVPSDE